MDPAKSKSVMYVRKRFKLRGAAQPPAQTSAEPPAQMPAQPPAPSPIRDQIAARDGSDGDDDFVDPAPIRKRRRGKSFVQESSWEASGDDSDSSAGDRYVFQNRRSPAAIRKRLCGKSGDDVDNSEQCLAADVHVAEKKKRPVSIRCSPKKFVELVRACSEDVKDRLHALGFDQLLKMNSMTLDRHLFIWLMDKFNPETMTLEIGGGKQIGVDEHSVWCVFMLNREGVDPPIKTSEEARRLRQQVRAQLYDGVQAGHIFFNDLKNKLENRTVNGDLAVRCFLMNTFCNLLFLNTDTKIRLNDVVWTEKVDELRHINWCKAVVNNLRTAGRLYRVEKKKK